MSKGIIKIVEGLETAGKVAAGLYAVVRVARLGLNGVRAADGLVAGFAGRPSTAYSTGHMLGGAAMNAATGGDNQKAAEVRRLLGY